MKYKHLKLGKIIIINFFFYNIKYILLSQHFFFSI